MSTDSDNLFQAIMRLPEAERLELAVRVMDNIPPDFPGLSFDDPGLLEELDRRMATPEGAITWAELRDRNA